MRRFPTPPTTGDANRWNGLKIGLLGGSFNPAHDGHLHIARLALAKLDLDFVWWLVTPQNPLKPRTGMMAYEKRFASVEAIIGRDPRMVATHIEAGLKSSYSYETVQRLLRLFPRTDFTFICGMDNALIFHRWERWRELANLVPIVFIARPPASTLVRHTPARMLKHPKIQFVTTTKLVDISSTRIRKSMEFRDL